MKLILKNGKEFKIDYELAAIIREKMLEKECPTFQFISNTNNELLLGININDISAIIK